MMKPLGIRISGEFSAFYAIPDGKGSWLAEGAIYIESERIGDFIIPQGAHNNLASIPKVVRSLYHVNAPHRIAAIIHDYLYDVEGQIYDHKFHSKKITRADADAVFYDGLRMAKGHYYDTLPSDIKAHMKLRGLDKAFIGEEAAKPLVGDFTAHVMYNAVRTGGWVHWRD